jgi:2-polyprenyl-3-methyl-5-hydroxy-6-metoxy-1,4-benzoquinol methylase
MSESLATTRHPHLDTLVSHVLSNWPEHRRVVEKSMADRDEGLMSHSDRLCDLICRLSAEEGLDLKDLASSYRFLCEKIVLPEELHFRRNGSYRLSRFEDAVTQVYGDREFMARYMKGLLVSYVLWLNHANAIRHYAERFLPGLPQGTRLLEVGPGHGLLMYLAAQRPEVATLTGWDVSQSSLEMTRRALVRLGVGRDFDLQEMNIFDVAARAELEGRFDAIVMSEVVEHLENPSPALEILLRLLTPGGKIWINVPANSPAPDHLYLLRNPAEASDLVRSSGFEVVEAESFPVAGASLERAIKKELTISCVVVGQRPV